MFAWLFGDAKGAVDEGSSVRGKRKTQRASVSFSAELATAPTDEPVRDSNRLSTTHGPNLEVLSRQVQSGSEPNVKRLRALALDDTLIIPAAELEQHDVIGAGTYGVVWKCKYYALPGTPAHPIVRDANDMVALKRRRHVVSWGGEGASAAAKSADETDLAKWMRELLLLRSLSHPNVIGYVGCTVRRGEDGQDELALVQEYAPHGSLYPLIHAPAGLSRPFAVADGVRWAHQIAAGMAYLHTSSPPIVHRNLRPENILLCGPRAAAKIADFHLSSFETNARHPGIDGASPGVAADAPSGSNHYTAPEMSRGEDFTHKADVYAFGMVMYELLMRRPAYGGDKQRSGEAARSAALSGARPSVPSRWPATAKDLVKRAWDPSPSTRIEFSLLEAELMRWRDEDSQATLAALERGSPKSPLELLGLGACFGRSFVERVMSDQDEDAFDE